MDFRNQQYFQISKVMNLEFKLCPLINKSLNGFEKIPSVFKSAAHFFAIRNLNERDLKI